MPRNAPRFAKTHHRPETELVQGAGESGCCMALRGAPTPLNIVTPKSVCLRIFKLELGPHEACLMDLHPWTESAHTSALLYMSLASTQESMK